jgi:CBS domain containing-hemolysin-like protein
MSFLIAAAIGFAALLYFSGLFSGSETAYFSLSRLDLSEMDPRSRARRLMDVPERLLIAILLGNTLVNVAAGSLGAVAALHLSRLRNYSEAVTIALEVGVVTCVILVVGEIAPKMYAMQRNRYYAERSSGILSLVMTVFRPAVEILHRLVSAVSGFVGEGDRPFVTAEELRTIVAISEQRGTLEEEERDMIDSVMEFGDTVIREVMVPRVDMACLEDTATIREAVTRVKELGYSRLPVYRGDIDHITGVLYAKDLLKYDAETEGQMTIAGLLRRAYYTPESKSAGELLRELQRDRTHIAIVVDEYGGTAGLVTLEDLIEEIVGEIRDEYDEEEPLVKVINKNTLIADGMVRLDELAEELGADIQGEGVETLGGFLMDAFGRIPSEGEKLERDGIEFAIEAVDEHRITRVRIEKSSGRGQGASQDGRDGT